MPAVQPNHLEMDVNSIIAPSSPYEPQSKKWNNAPEVGNSSTRLNRLKSQYIAFN